MTTTLTVEGMSCEHCEQTVQDALRDVSGVTSADADREREEATVDVESLVTAVEDAGYSASA